MRSKYVMISGLAFSEEDDMEKLKNYARQGWILEGITGGFFYKLKKDNPQDLVYSVDYQIGADEEYFAMFKEAGWDLVTSVGNQIYIFMAQVGAKPIYSDSESEVNKYITMRNQTKKGSLYSLLVAIALIFLSIISIKPISFLILGLLVIDICVFIFNFMPYVAYNYRIKQIQKVGKCKEEKNKKTWKLFIFSAVLFLVVGILYLSDKKYFGIFFIILGISNIISSSKYYKKYKKSIQIK
ncbi:DUF2812 domain-containing protein [Clostridium tertium]